MRTIFAFTLTTRAKYYEEGDMVFDSSGSDIGRVLRCHRVANDGANSFYSYDIESTVDTFKKLQANEIELYEVTEYNVHPCHMAYTSSQ